MVGPGLIVAFGWVTRSQGEMETAWDPGSSEVWALKAVPTDSPAFPPPPHSVCSPSFRPTCSVRCLQYSAVKKKNNQLSVHSEPSSLLLRPQPPAHLFVAENRRAVEALQAEVSLLSSPSTSFLSREPADRDSDNVERGHTLPQLVQGGRRAMNIQLTPAGSKLSSTAPACEGCRGACLE